MAVFVGVSKTLPFLKDTPGKANFWCVSGQTKFAQPRDQLLLYFPLGASRSTYGIAQVYLITSTPRSVYRSPCAARGMSPVDTSLLLNLRERITVKDMKADPVVRDWGAVRRSMQGVTFFVPKEIWPHLRALVVTRNPDADSILEAGR